MAKLKKRRAEEVGKRKRGEMEMVQRKRGSVTKSGATFFQGVKGAMLRSESISYESSKKG
jgi:hypothetical protein